MGFKKTIATEPVITAPSADAVVPSVRAAAPDHTVTRQDVAAAITSLKKEYSADEKRAHGQVRMHGIIAGYKVAGLLAPTLANTSAAIKDELHKLAAEVADKIEAYSFAGDA